MTNTDLRMLDGASCILEHNAARGGAREVGDER